MKYYLFRDLNNDNLLDGKSYHAAGIVNSIHCELDKPNGNGKDLSVLFFHPFECTITYAWRTLNEVELFEVDKYEYDSILSQYLTLRKTI